MRRESSGGSCSRDQAGRLKCRRGKANDPQQSRHEFGNELDAESMSQLHGRPHQNLGS